jgi:hypothetical protein
MLKKSITVNRIKMETAQLMCRYEKAGKTAFFGINRQSEMEKTRINKSERQTKG